MYKIRKFKMEHEFLGTIDLDFVKDDGSAYDTILLVGENGSGKTSVLNALTAISKIYFEDNSSINEKILCFETEIEFHNKYKIVFSVIPSFYSDKQNPYYASNIEIKQFKIEEKWVEPTPDDDFITDYYLNGENEKSQKLQFVDVCLETNIDYKKSDINQYIIDIYYKDSYDISEYVRSNPNNNVPKKLIDSRTTRFKKAFNFMFDGKIEFQGVFNNEVLFQKNDTQFDASTLSSGEKQIVYRATSLLKDENATNGIPVLFEEPEISMHPKWQEKIYDFIKDLFSDKNCQKSQIFITTHSDYILKRAMEDENALIIKLEIDSGGKLKSNPIKKSKNDLILPTLTIGELKWHIFDIPSIDFHCALYGYIQNNLVIKADGSLISIPDKNKSATVKETDAFLVNNGNAKKISSYKNFDYNGITTFIRNKIHHPTHVEKIQFSNQDLNNSIKFMVDLIESYKNN